MFWLHIDSDRIFLVAVNDAIMTPEHIIAIACDERDYILSPPQP